MARDGACGRIHDFYFDDERWVLRYLVLDTGRWIPGRRVLVPASWLIRASSVGETISVDLARDEISALPDIDSDMPVSRQHVLRIASQVTESFPGMTPAMSSAEITGDPHLQSVKEVLGYAVHALDGAVGQVDEFVLDASSWALRYLVVDMRARGAGKLVVVPTSVVERISWLSVDLELRMSAAAIAQGLELSEIVSPHTREPAAAGAMFASRDRHVS